MKQQSSTPRGGLRGRRRRLSIFFKPAPFELKISQNTLHGLPVRFRTLPPRSEPYFGQNSFFSPRAQNLPGARERRRASWAPCFPFPRANGCPVAPLAPLYPYYTRGCATMLLRNSTNRTSSSLGLERQNSRIFLWSSVASILQIPVV